MYYSIIPIQSNAFFSIISIYYKKQLKQVYYMKKSNNIIIRYIILATIGFLLHFTYDWSGQNNIVGLFSATNESTWEHLKLLFFPMLFITIWDSLRGNTSPGFLKRRIMSIIAGMVVIVVMFYTALGVTSRLMDWYNIATYLISLLVTLLLDKFITVEDNLYSAYTALALFILFTVAFAVFSFKAPDIGIFYPFPAGTKCFPIV